MTSEPTHPTDPSPAEESPVGHEQQRERAGDSADPVGATSRWGKPVTIAGAVVVVLAILWGIIAGGWFL